MSLRVCYLLPRLLPHESGTVVGGCAVNCISLASVLQAEGIYIQLLTSVSQGNVKNLNGQPFVEYTTCVAEVGNGLIRKGLGAIRGLRRGLKDALRRNHFDVVHSHAGTYPYAVLPLAADGKTSVRLHSLYCPLGAKGGVFSKWWEHRVAARMVFNRLDRVIAVTDNVRRSIEETGVRPEKIESIPMCVDTRRFYPRNRNGAARYFSDSGGRARLLFVGNASREKGLAELLHAVKILTERQIPVFLVAAIENQSEIREYSAGYDSANALIRELGIETQVRLVGVVDQIEDLYLESDILVIPWKTSRGPSDFPLVALEAMAMGKCVVSTPVGGCPELLNEGDAGLLADGFSAAHVASAIEFAIGHPDVRRRTEQMAVERVRDFSLHTSATRLIALYERLLEDKGRCDTAS